MEVTFNQGYGSSSKTVKVTHGYRCVKVEVFDDVDELVTKLELPTDQLLAVVKCFRTLELNNG